MKTMLIFRSNMLTVSFERSIFTLSFFILLFLNSNGKSESMTSAFIMIFFLPIFTWNVSLFRLYWIPIFKSKTSCTFFLTLAIDPLLLRCLNNYLAMTLHTHFLCNHYLKLHNWMFHLQTLLCNTDAFPV